jgi:tetratricopeptide (TPR) repeat protein
MKASNVEQLFQKGLAYHQNGYFNDALKAYYQILEINPKHFDALQLTATIFLQCKKYSEALNFFKSALKIKSNHVPALINFGNLQFELEHYDEALKAYDKAIRLEPGNPGAYNNRGNVLKDLNRLDEALKNYNVAIQLKPNYAEAYNNRGALLNQLKRFDEAIISLNEAIKLKPNNPEAFYNLANAKKDPTSFDEALQNYNEAIKLKPNYAEAFNNRGSLLNDHKHFDEALQNYNEAIKLKPNYAEAIANKAYLKLLLGEFDEGWQLHEFRKNKKDRKKHYPKFPAPLWLGQVSIEDKIILVHSEQGLGDTLQFYRYLTILQTLNPKEIIFHIEKPLISILSGLNENITILNKNKNIPYFDYYCPLMSLPLAFKTSIDTIPNDVPYLLVDNIKSKQWQDRLGHKKKARVGIVWSGSTHHENDHNRSLTLTQISLLFELPFEFHCLQKEIREVDIETLNDIKVINQHQESLHDFSDTAALISQMDLIISVDTAVAHLAGALGKKVWILLPFKPDFRWLLVRDDSPWYPTARIFRQPEINDWETVIQELIGELKDNKFL